MAIAVILSNPSVIKAVQERLGPARPDKGGHQHSSSQGGKALWARRNRRKLHLCHLFFFFSFRPSSSLERCLFVWWRVWPKVCVGGGGAYKKLYSRTPFRPHNVKSPPHSQGVEPKNRLSGGEREREKESSLDFRGPK